MSIPTVALSGVPDPLPEGLVVLDVREQVEWDHGHIEGALHVPLMDLPDRLAELSSESQILVVCKVGGLVVSVADGLGGSSGGGSHAVQETLPGSTGSAAG